MENPRRILLIRPSALGDVCRTVPVLASLRARFPEARIDWLVQEGFEPAVTAHPALTTVVTFPRRAVALGRLWRPGAARRLRAFLRSLAEPAYDLVIDCQGLGRSGFFARATGAPRRVGYANAAELGWLGLTERHAIDRQRHTVDRMLALVERAGIPPVLDMRLYTTEADRIAADDLVRADRYALIAPTSRWPGKRWPIDRYAELARALLTTSLDAIVIVGGPDEREQCASILEVVRHEPRLRDAVGRTSIGTLMALVERAAIVVANDSAPVHMAVGFERPLVAL